MDLFEFPQAAPATRKAVRPALMVPAPTTSHINGKASADGYSQVRYVRMSDADHKFLKDTVAAIHDALDLNGEVGACMRQIADEVTRNYAHELRRYATLGDMLEGVKRRLNEPHPQVRDRLGKDCTVSQLKSINKVIDAFNKAMRVDTLSPITIPTK